MNLTKEEIIEKFREQEKQTIAMWEISQDQENIKIKKQKIQKALQLAREDVRSITFTT